MPRDGVRTHHVAAILLAAGRSKRMGCDKLALSLGGKTLLARAVDLLCVLPVNKKILVTTSARTKIFKVPPSIRLVTVESPVSVQSDSVRLGVFAAGSNAVGSIPDSFMFLTGDQPLLTLEDVTQLLEAAAAHNESIIYASVRGVPCTPTIFPARLKGELMSLIGDRGGRAIIRSRRGECIPVDVACPDHFTDIDTEQDFQSLKKQITFAERHGQKNE